MTSTVLGKYLTLSDGAKLYYKELGQGDPIILIHGWPCSNEFFRKNIEELAKTHRVITPDLRGYGNSSKILSGHTMIQYGKDIAELISQLKLSKVHLAGWSMGGSIVLSYWQQFSKDQKLASLALIDSDPYPFSKEDWNPHGLRVGQADGLNAMFQTYQADPAAFFQGFVGKMFKSGQATEDDMAWMKAEMLKTPPIIAMAAYSDFVISDYEKVVPTVTVPFLVIGADSGVYPQGEQLAHHLAARAPKGYAEVFKDGGHLLFYEQPEKFNSLYLNFITK